jgi:hypothetical protein
MKNSQHSTIRNVLAGAGAGLLSATRTNVYQCSLVIETLNAINDHIGVIFTEKSSRIDFETMDDKEICIVTKSKKQAFLTW